MTNPTDDLFEESQLNKDGQESLESYIKKIRKLSTSFPNEYPEEDLIFKINLGETLYQSRILYGLEIFQKLADDKILTKYQTHYYTRLVLERKSELEYTKLVKGKYNITGEQLANFKLDKRIVKLTAKTIKLMQGEHTTAKIYQIKDLNAKDFRSVISGDDQPYQDLRKLNEENAAWSSEYCESKILQKLMREKNRDRIMQQFGLNMTEYAKKLKKVRANPSLYLEKELNQEKMIGSIEEEKNETREELIEQIRKLKHEVQLYRTLYKQEVKDRIFNSHGQEEDTVPVIPHDKVSLPDMSVETV